LGPSQLGIEEAVTNHGQFDRTRELVAAVHTNGGGIHPGFQAAHAFGRVYTGTFSAPAARLQFFQESFSRFPSGKMRTAHSIAHQARLAAWLMPCSTPLTN